MQKCFLSLFVLAAVAFASAESPVVVIETTLGDIEVELYADKAPITVANFLTYVDEGFYDETIFHRVIADFMIQTGAHTADFTEKPGKAAIKNECANGLKNTVGTVGMARLPEFDSATSQFYINVADNVHSDGQYCVFGKVIKGMKTVDRIKAVPTGTETRVVNGVKEAMTDVPLETVTIISIKRK
jgi:cyclophilin family peptidyl-prolyl cis-trans isomerase